MGEKGTGLRERQEHKRTTQENKAVENGKSERSTEKVKVSAALPLGVVRGSQLDVHVRRRKGRDA